nr:class I SAM-dependent DNA methyltransferase [Pseudomonas aeruginosa]
MPLFSYTRRFARLSRSSCVNTENHSQTAAFLWSIADLLRGDFKQSQYGRIILPFTLLRRMECVLEPTKEVVIRESYAQEGRPDLVRERLLLRAAGQQFFNASKLTLGTLSDTQTAADLMSYVQSFSKDAREIFEHFHFEDFVQQLSAANLLYQVVQRFAATDLSPERISNFGMGIIFEELIRKFAESSNETAGEHFTPRDIVHLTTSLVITDQDHKLAPNSIVTIYDPTAGTGGFLSEGDEYIQSISQQVTVSLHGQELNPESYAICKADMLIKGQDVTSIKLGNTLSNDQLAGPEHRFDFMLSNPPFGVEWKKVQKQITDEHTEKGYNGRFGPGLPRVSDGSLLFLLHLVSKMRDPREGGSRIGIILNGSPLFTGGAGSGESEIRRYLLQNDLVEAIIALPTDMFYNTGIATYVWVLSNHKAAVRKGKVQLIDGSQHFAKMRKSLGSKRQYITDEQIDELVRLYGRFEETPQSKIFPVDAFGYRRISVERPLRLNFQASPERIDKVLEEKAIEKMDQPLRQQLITALQAMDASQLHRNREQFSKLLKKTLNAHDVFPSTPELKAILNALSERDPEADICTSKGQPEADAGLRDNENVPLGESVYDYFEREVKPHVPDAWIDESKRDEQDGEVGIVGFEIPVNRHFYVFQPPRPLDEIDRDLKACTDRIKQMIEGLSA